MGSGFAYTRRGRLFCVAALSTILLTLVPAPASANAYSGFQTYREGYYDVGSICSIKNGHTSAKAFAYGDSCDWVVAVRAKYWEFGSYYVTSFSDFAEFATKPVANAVAQQIQY